MGKEIIDTLENGGKMSWVVSTACPKEEIKDICPYYSKCKFRENGSTVSYSILDTPKDLVHFSLWQLAPKNRFWIHRHKKRYLAFSCGDNHPHYRSILEKEISQELKEKTYDKLNSFRDKLMDVFNIDD